MANHSNNSFLESTNNNNKKNWKSQKKTAYSRSKGENSFDVNMDSIKIYCIFFCDQKKIYRIQYVGVFLRFCVPLFSPNIMLIVSFIIISTWTCFVIIFFSFLLLFFMHRNPNYQTTFRNVLLRICFMCEWETCIG